METPISNNGIASFFMGTSSIDGSYGRDFPRRSGRGEPWMTGCYWDDHGDCNRNT
jgi:hypothetical protein